MIDALPFLHMTSERRIHGQWKLGKARRVNAIKSKLGSERSKMKSDCPRPAWSFQCNTAHEVGRDGRRLQNEGGRDNDHRNFFKDVVKTSLF